MSFNIHSEVTLALNDLVNEKIIQIVAYNGQTNIRGIVTTSYSAPYQTLARVQLETPQTLQHLENINMTLVYKRFYINSYSLTGLNRQLNTGGDYIMMDTIKYKIIQVLENFESGYVCVIGCQSN